MGMFTLKGLSQGILQAEIEESGAAIFSVRGEKNSWRCGLRVVGNHIQSELQAQPDVSALDARPPQRGDRRLDRIAMAGDREDEDRRARKGNDAELVVRAAIDEVHQHPRCKLRFDSLPDPTSSSSMVKSMLRLRSITSTTWAPVATSLTFSASR